MSTLVIASDPHELVAAHKTLIQQIEDKIASAIDEAKQAKGMVDQMIAARLGKNQATTIHRRATARVAFLSKIKHVLSLGYCMMPDMPGDVIAVRVNEDAVRPAGYLQSHSWRSSVPDTSTAALPAGEGKYISPEPKIRKYQTTDSAGKEVTRYQAVALRDPDGLDKQFIRPQVIDRTHAAMVTKAFDEIVTVRQDGRRKNRDPIVLGRIIDPVSNRSAAFLIAWFADATELWQPPTADGQLSAADCNHAA